MSVSDSTYRATFCDGASVLERVLLAIIDAHTTCETEGHQAERLQAAMTALIGPVAPERRDMDKALLFMARQRRKDTCDYEMQTLRSCAGAPRSTTRSISELATLAARDVIGCTAAVDMQATARILCEMFRPWGKAYGGQDHIQETLETEAVQRLCDELAEWGVATRI